VRIDDGDLSAGLFDLNELITRDGALQRLTQLINRRLN
jgi:hypothetical protein